MRQAGGEHLFCDTFVFLQQIASILSLPLFCTILPEHHPCVGALAMLEIRVIMTTVTHCQIETQDGAQLDIVDALVVIFPGRLSHLAIQYEDTLFSIAANN